MRPGEHTPAVGKGKAKAVVARRTRSSAKVRRAAKASSSNSSANGQTMSIASVNAPVAKGSKISITKEDRSYRYRGTDFLRTIDLQDAQNNQAGSMLLALPLNPLTFKSARLNQLAKLYQQYKVNKLVVHAVPCQPTNTGGQVLMYFDQDVARIPTSGGTSALRFALSHAKAQMSSVWLQQDAVYPVDHKWRMCNLGAGDARASNFGIFYVMIAATAGVAAYPAQLYTLTVEYDFEFKTEVVLEDPASAGLELFNVVPYTSTTPVYPVVTAVQLAGPVLPFRYGIATVVDAGTSSLDPGTAYYVAGDATIAGAIALFRQYDDAYINYAADPSVNGSSAAEQISWTEGSPAILDIQPLSGYFADETGTLTRYVHGVSSTTSLKLNPGNTVMLDSIAPSTTAVDFIDTQSQLANDETVAYDAVCEGGAVPDDPSHTVTGVMTGNNTENSWAPALPVVLVRDTALKTIGPVWKMFTRAGTLITAFVNVARNVRTFVRIVRERRANAPSLTAADIAFLALSPRARFLTQLGARGDWYRRLDAAGLLADEWLDVKDYLHRPVTVWSPKIRPFMIRPVLETIEEEDFRDGERTGSTTPAPFNHASNRSDSQLVHVSASPTRTLSGFVELSPALALALPKPAEQRGWF